MHKVSGITVSQSTGITVCKSSFIIELISTCFTRFQGTVIRLHKGPVLISLKLLALLVLNS